MSDQEQAGQPSAGAGHGSLRVSHEDRDQVAEALRVAAGDGRLTADELDERLEKALTARTYDDLAVLVADLPAAGTALAPLPAPLAALLPGGTGHAAAKELVKIHTTSGQSTRVGRWTVPARMDLKVTSGHIKVDLTEAVITQPTLRIDAEVQSGQLKLVTKPGIVVDADDVGVRSGEVKIREPWGHDVPVTLRIELAGQVRSGAITARPPRRTFWQWLLRRPRPYQLPAR